MLLDFGHTVSTTCELHHNCSAGPVVASSRPGAYLVSFLVVLLLLLLLGLGYFWEWCRTNPVEA